MHRLQADIKIKLTTLQFFSIKGPGKQNKVNLTIMKESNLRQ